MRTSCCPSRPHSSVRGSAPDFLVDQEASAYAQLRPAVVEARGETRSDMQIAFALAERLGLGNLFWNGDLEAAHRHQLAPSGITLETLRANPQGVRAPQPVLHRKYAAPVDGHPAGFDTPSRKVEIFAERFQEHGYEPLPDYVEPAIGKNGDTDVSDAYPLVLTCAKSTHYLHSQNRNLPSLRRHEPDPLVEINPETAAAHAIGEGDWVTLTTPHSSLRARARFAAKLHPKVVSATHGWWQGCEELFPFGLPGRGQHQLQCGDRQRDHRPHRRLNAEQCLSLPPGAFGRTRRVAQNAE